MFNEDKVTINIELTKDEALVLFNFLNRFSKFDSLKFEDQSEKRALWNLQCLMEKTIGKVLDGSNYEEIQEEIRVAQDNLKDNE